MLIQQIRIVSASIWKPKVSKLVLLVIFVLCLSSMVNAIHFNEIMYNPKGSDNNNEYLEIFSGGVDLSGYNIEDFKADDVLELVKEVESDYALIVEEGFDYSDLNCSVYSAGAAIGNNLNNDGDLIILRDPNGTIVDALRYHSNWGGYGNDQALCIGWEECLPNPCTGEIWEFDEKYYNIKINELLPDPYGYDNASMPQGEWIELYNGGDEILDLEGLELYDKAGKSLEISDSRVLNGTKIWPKDYLVVYTNGKSGFLNNDGFEKISLKKGNFLIDAISYSDSQEGSSWSNVNEFWILNQASPGLENFEPFENTTESKVRILEIKEEKVKWGEDIEVRVLLYKGETNRKVVSLDFDEDITEKIKFHLDQKYVEVEMVLVLKTEDNCDRSLEDGEYLLVLKGFEKEDEEVVEIKGVDYEKCNPKNLTSSVKVSSERTLNPVEETEIINDDDYIEKNIKAEEEPIIKFQSQGESAKRSGIFFFGALLIVLIIALMKKNEKRRTY